MNYASPWPMSSIAGECNGGRVNFHEYNSAVVCANCHSTWNHRAPLFGNFDTLGEYMATPQVLVPIDNSPFAVMGDWLPPGEGMAWKDGVPVASLAELGAAMAADDEVIACGVKRMWNYAMSRGDIVNNGADVPSTVIDTLVTDFKSSNFNMKTTLRSILVHDDFVRF
jgi:hypothetical protein